MSSDDGDAPVMLCLASKPRVPTYTPPPLPDGHVRIKIDEDYDAGPCCHRFTGDGTPYPAGVFDIPAEQAKRWEEAEAAWEAAQREMYDLRLSRADSVPDGWVRKEPPPRGPVLEIHVLHPDPLHPGQMRWTGHDSFDGRYSAALAHPAVIEWGRLVGHYPKRRFRLVQFTPGEQPEIIREWPTASPQIHA